MEMLNIKLGRAVESVKIKPSSKLKEMQNNEELVAVNERVEEAIMLKSSFKQWERIMKVS